MLTDASHINLDQKRVPGVRLSRVLIGTLALSCLFPLVSSTTSRSADHGQRSISLYNVHTKEHLTVSYKKNGKYIASAMKKINHIMRDWRQDRTIVMDPKLIDLIWQLHSRLGSKEPIHLLSGYRSRKTNNALRHRGGGQAINSRHILGKAADIHFPDIAVKKMRNVALVWERGGVGYYPTSNLPFIHVDTGRVRHWPRLGRYELAALFPSGQSKHTPRKGGPISKRDYHVAMAKLNKKQKRLIRIARKESKPSRPPVRVASLNPIHIRASQKQTTPLIIPHLPWPKADNSRSLEWPTRAPAPYTIASSDPISDLLPPSSKKQAAAKQTASLNHWARAPDYDPEHPDELSYHPFPILPLMTATPFADDRQLAGLVHPDQSKIDQLTGQPKKIIAFGFRRGPQFAGMLRALQFTGRAVPNLFVGTESAGNLAHSAIGYKGSIIR